MATVSADSELMTNYASAAAVPPSSNFVALVDDENRPMIFCLSDATDKALPKIQLIKQDGNGNRFIYNLADSVGLKPSEKILAFDIQQAANGSVFLTFAVESGRDESVLYIVKPFRVTTEVLLDNVLRLPCIAKPQSKIGRVHSIYLVSLQ